MDEMERQDDALFEALRKSKKRKKRRRIITVFLILCLLIAGVATGVIFLRRRVTRQFMARSGEATSAKVSYGSISTQVSGSGTLVNVDEESITIPAGVTIDEITVSEHENVISGQLLAKINIASVMQAISSIQETIQSLDSDITDAGYDVIDKEIKAGVAGRIKQIYAKDGDDVIACMYEHGALALLSLDGYMAVEIDAGSLSAASSVRVQLADGSELDAGTAAGH